MSLLELSKLRKTYGSLVAVDDVSFNVDAGELFGLLGPNGAGKSTTMMMIAGLLHPDSGTIRLNGRPLDPQDRESRRLLGVVPQELAIYPNLTARENLAFYGRLYGVTKTDLKPRMKDVLDRIGLTERADDLTATFSGGMKRRLNFGAALLHKPQLLLLDEPTVGVDPQSRAHLLNCVRELAAQGVAVIYCSHYMEEVQELCDRVAVIDHGNVLACDHIDHLLQRVEHEVRLQLSGVSDELKWKLADRDGLSLQQRDSELVVTIPVGEAETNGRLLSTLVSVLSSVQESDGQLTAVESDEPDLERLFLQLTGSRLRD